MAVGGSGDLPAPGAAPPAVPTGGSGGHVSAVLASAARGGALGATLGAAFHVVGGASVRARGRTTLQPQHIAAQALSASARLGAIFAAYSALRGTLHAATGSDALACMGAGAACVAAATAANPAREELLRVFIAAALQPLDKGSRTPRVVPRHLILASAATSGAFTLGGADLVLHTLGVSW